MKQTMKRPVLGLLWILGIAATVGCSAPNPQAECRAILETVDKVRTQPTQDRPTRQAMLQTAQRYEQVADELQAMSIRTLDIKQHFPMLVSGHQDVAEALSERAELVNARGVIAVRQGDNEDAEDYRKLQTEENRAQNQIETALGLITSNCQISM